eukprot:6204610-Pleurochrysis_carterae.AAC.2
MTANGRKTGTRRGEKEACSGECTSFSQHQSRDSACAARFACAWRRCLLVLARVDDVGDVGDGDGGFGHVGGDDDQSDARWRRREDAHLLRRRQHGVERQHLPGKDGSRATRMQPMHARRGRWEAIAREVYGVKRSPSSSHAGAHASAALTHASGAPASGAHQHRPASEFVVASRFIGASRVLSANGDLSLVAVAVITIIVIKVKYLGIQRIQWRVRSNTCCRCLRRLSLLLAKTLFRATTHVRRSWSQLILSRSLAFWPHLLLLFLLSDEQPKRACALRSGAALLKPCHFRLRRGRSSTRVLVAHHGLRLRRSRLPRRRRPLPLLRQSFWLQPLWLARVRWIPLAQLLAQVVDLALPG